MEWKELKDIKQLEEIKKDTSDTYHLIYKHSTRCSISAAAMNRLERHWNQEQLPNVIPYYLDLIRYRPVSNEIESLFGVEHESPQVILIKKGKVIYHESHGDIRYEGIVEKV